jgi:copper chaperone CopZ
VPTAKLLVRNLEGDDAARRLESALLRLAGVHGAVASRTDHCVEVDFEDDEVAVREIIDAAADAGFDAQLVG